MKQKIFLYALLLVIITFLFQVCRTHYRYYKNDNLNIVLNNYSGDIISGDNESSNSFIKPYATSKSEPQNFKLKYEIKTENNENTFSSNVSMNSTNNYSNIKGISTFRGNNYRENASFGTVNVLENKLTKIWTKTIGQTDNWTGIGWNGQPAIITWDDDIKKQMNLYDKFKEKENFTEVIYGGLDSYIHFYDLETGEETRDKIRIPSAIKGSVTLDPRGYPLLYVGQGIDTNSGEVVKMGYYIFSLIDGKELYFINGRDKFAYLNWAAFDGNPVIDSTTDTMFLAGENGVIYIVKLNTNYNKENGTISINPNTTRYRYTINGRAAGSENAIAIYKNYAYFINNHGYIQCLDLSTLTPIWIYYMEDDCDATLGLEEEDGKIMLYAACEVDRRTQNSPAFIRKIDGTTGEMIWEYSLECYYDANVNGGVLSSPIVGKNEIEDLVIYNIAKTGKTTLSGKLVALYKNDGKIAWEKDLNMYSWSSPVAIYDANSKANIIFCDANGKIFLIDARTGETKTSLNTGGGNIEGSPAIYNDIMVIGTRGKRIYGIKIK